MPLSEFFIDSPKIISVLPDNDECCWQYRIRLKNMEDDLSLDRLSPEIAASLKISDFTFEYVAKENRPLFNVCKKFIERHEWLGKISNYPTHLFIAKYDNRLAGVLIMDMPTAFSYVLGEDTPKMERLISRGACVSWSPKNLASSLIMWAIKYMVKNTEYRIFTAYSDPEAKELGTIYQACNFIYMGQTYGTSKMFECSPGKWVSDRYFRSRSVYKRTAKEHKIKWNPLWQNKDVILWENMPKEIELLLKNESNKLMLNANSKIQPKKHKYCYILGKDKRETRKLTKTFYELNPKLKNLKYPVAR